TGLLQGGEQPDALGARSPLAAARTQGLRRPPPGHHRRPRMNKTEALKTEKDGLEVSEDLVRFAREGWKTIGDDDKERLKWVGVFQRKPTPGHFMMRIRMPNRVISAAQARLLGEITNEAAAGPGRAIADVTTR